MRRQTSDIESPKPGGGTEDDKYGAKPTGLTGDWPAIMLLLLLYTLQGVPMGLGASVPMLMVDKGVSTMEQAVFSMVAYPFAFKLLWAPLVDSVYISSFGRRKTWIVPAQLAIGGLLLLASPRVGPLLGDGGAAPDVNTLTALFFTFYFLAATQDIAVDGLALTILSERNKEYGATCNAIGQTFGYFLSYVGFLGLNTYGLASLGGFMFFWGWVFLASTLWVLTVRNDEFAPQPGSKVSQLAAAYKEMATVLTLGSVRSLALMLLTVKAPLAAFEALVPLELQKGGVPKEHLAAITIVMLPLSMVTQGYVSKHFQAAPADGSGSGSGGGGGGAQPLSIFLKGWKAKLANGVLCVLLIFGIAAAPRGADGGIPWWLYGLGVLCTVVSSVSGAGMFVAQMAFYNRVSDPKIGGTYMTMLNTLSNLGGQYPSTLVLTAKGAIEKLGVENGFYGVSLVSVLFGVAWLALMEKRVLALQALPREKWLASSAAA